MGKTKITEEQLKEELRSGLAIEEIAERHGMKAQSVKTKMKILGLGTGGTQMDLESVATAGCFAFDRFTGECTCLTVGKCPGEKCGFYKEAKRALEEMKGGPGTSAYDRYIEAAIMMVRMNQGIGA